MSLIGDKCERGKPKQCLTKMVNGQVATNSAEDMCCFYVKSIENATEGEEKISIVTSDTLTNWR